jgi:hypothetical protein
MPDSFSMGSDVMGSDGKKIGLLNNVRGEYIGINPAEDIPAYWLPMSCIVETGPMSVTLAFGSADLDQYKVGSGDLPSGEGTDAPVNPSQARGAA